MIINKKLFPISSNFATIASLHQRMEQLQVQLGTGKRADSLSDLGIQRLNDLALRARLGRIDAYNTTIDSVNFRIDLLDNVVSRLDEIESDARGAAGSTGAGTDGVGVASAQSLALSQLDEVITILRTEVNGRYMFGGSTTDIAPVESLSAILDGSGGRDGFRTIASERRQADLGADGMARLISGNAGLTSGMPATDTVSLTEAAAAGNPQRPQIDAIATSNPAEITVTGPAGVPPEVTAQFGAGVAAGDTVTIDVVLPGGAVESRVLTAVAGTPANPGEFEIGATADDTALNFQAALDEVMAADTVTLTEDGDHIFGAKLSAISTDSSAISATDYPTPATAGTNAMAYVADTTPYGATDTSTFEITVDGVGPVTVTIDQATVMGVGNSDAVIDDIDELEAVLTDALATAGVTGVTVSNDGTDIVFTSDTTGAASGVAIDNVIGDADGGGAAHTAHGLVAGAGTAGKDAGAPLSMSIRFTGTPLAGEQVVIGLTLPDGTSHTVTMSAVAEATGNARQFEIGDTPAETAANFQAALDVEIQRLGETEVRAASLYAAADNFFAGEGETVMRVDGPPFDSATGLVAADPDETVIWYVGEDGAGRARDTVTARVDDGTVISYGVRANEGGIANLVRSLAVVAAENFPDGDPSSVERFNAINQTQMQRLSSYNSGQPGSLEVISLEIGIAHASAGQASERHTMIASQLDTMLTDIEGVSMEEVAAELLNLQVRLEASYQTTSMVSQLTLVNFMPS